MAILAKAKGKGKDDAEKPLKRLRQLPTIPEDLDSLGQQASEVTAVAEEQTNPGNVNLSRFHRFQLNP